MSMSMSRHAIARELEITSNFSRMAIENTLVLGR
jgi:hypothetical protein